MEVNYKKYYDLKGKVRGDVLLTDIKYIEKKEGLNKVQKFKKNLSSIDPDLDFKKIRVTGWYPIAWKVIILLQARKALHWQDKDIVDMGAKATKQSFILQTLLRYFISLEMTFKETPRYWQKYWDAGEFVPYFLNLNKKKIIFQIKDFKIHPDLSLYFLGHFKSFANLVLKSESLQVKETKSVFRGDQYEEYEINW
jgi:hypothetical protein